MVDDGVHDDFDAFPSLFACRDQLAAVEKETIAIVFFNIRSKFECVDILDARFGLRPVVGSSRRRIENVSSSAEVVSSAVDVLQGVLSLLPHFLNVVDVLGHRLPKMRERVDPHLSVSVQSDVSVNLAIEFGRQEFVPYRP